MINKAIGSLMIVGGLGMIVGFPWVRDYQSDEFAKGGILFGIVLVVIGLFLIGL